MMVRTWTGKESRALRQALRLSQREFASMLDLTERTITKWEARGSTITPLPDSQGLLDTALSRASEAAHTTFSQLLAEAEQAPPDPAPPTSDSGPSATVLLPLMVEGHPTLAPLPAEWATELSIETADPSRTGDSDALEGDAAVSPLNRREFLQHGMTFVAGSPFQDCRVLGSPAQTGPTTNTPAVAPWAYPIYDAVLHPAGSVSNATAPDPFERTFHDGDTPRRAVERMVAAELASDYVSLSGSLPSLIRSLATGDAHSRQGNDGLHQRLLSDAYTTAGWALIKADSPLGAVVAAQAAIQAAERTEDALRIAAATRCLAEVHMRAGHFAEATRTALLAAIPLDTAPSTPRPSAVTLRGAALLTAAASAARGGDHRAAHTALESAQACATELKTDRSELGVVFGPTNVAIHQVAVAVELGDIQRALRHVPTVTVDNLPPGLTERRARFLIDVSRSHAGVGDDAAALDALLHAENTAPDELRQHRLTRDLVTDMLTRERRSSDLRSLAQRCDALN